jgi:hypothetical protein
MALFISSSLAFVYQGTNYQISGLSDMNKIQHIALSQSSSTDAANMLVMAFRDYIKTPDFVVYGIYRLQFIDKGDEFLEDNELIVKIAKTLNNNGYFSDNIDHENEQILQQEKLNEDIAASINEPKIKANGEKPHLKNKHATAPRISYPKTPTSATQAISNKLKRRRKRKNKRNNRLKEKQIAKKKEE